MTPCRRCTECKGQDHHWLEHGAPLTDDCPHGELLSTDCESCIRDAPAYVCKHCEAPGDACDWCDEGLTHAGACTACDGTGVIERGQNRGRHVVLVCGGRDYTDVEHAFEVLDEVHAKCPITLIVHGGARGADMLANAWARKRGIPVSVHPAKWREHGRGAGPIRNRFMFAAEKPDTVVAFPGGNGTEDMVRVASEYVRAGVMDPVHRHDFTLTSCCKKHPLPAPALARSGARP